MTEQQQSSLLDKAVGYTPTCKNVLITGGTKGIGRATVEELGAVQCHVYTCARNAEDLEELLDHCKSQGWDVTGSVADVSKAEDRKLLVQKVSEHFNGSLDVLINNVGMNIRKPAVEYTEEEYHTLYSTNLESALFMSTAAHALLKASTKGGIVIMNSSVAGGPTALRSGVLYGSTKAAMNHVTRHLACEWAADGIRVIGVAPWYTETPLAMQVLKDKEFNDAVMSRTPLKRVAQPIEVARVLCFMASPAASFITGQTLAVDGGYSVMGLF